MVKDLGVRARPRRGPGQKAVLAVAALAALAFPVWLLGGAYLKDRAEAVTLAREWSVEGRACPSLTRAEFERQGLKASKGLHYEGVEFWRQFGHVSCSPIRHDAGAGWGAYAVCQFTSPNVLRVTTRKGEWYFAPGLGQPATVSTPRGHARCVLASNFTLR